MANEVDKVVEKGIAYLAEQRAGIDSAVKAVDNAVEVGKSIIRAPQRIIQEGVLPYVAAGTKIIKKTTEVVAEVADTAMWAMAMFGKTIFKINRAQQEITIIANLLKDKTQGDIGKNVLHPLNKRRMTAGKLTAAIQDISTGKKPSYIYQIGNLSLPINTYFSPKSSWTKVEDKLADGKTVMELTTQDFTTVSLSMTVDTNEYAGANGNSKYELSKDHNFTDRAFNVVPFEEAINILNTGLPLPIKNNYFAKHLWKWGVITSLTYQFREDGSGMVDISLDLTIVSDDAGILVEKSESNNQSKGMSATPVE